MPAKHGDREHGRGEFAQSWSIAAALIDGPLTLEGIRDYYQLMARRFGIFSDVFALRSGSRNGPDHGPWQHLAESLAELADKGWIVQEQHRYRLTETGRRQALVMLDELKRGRAVLDGLTDPRRVSLVTLVIHFVLAALKLPAALLSGSVGLLNDALDTLMDGISSIVVFFGFRFNRERLASIVLVVFMLVTGGFTFYEVVARIIRPTATNSDPFAFAAMLVSALVCALLWAYAKFAGLRCGSMALITQSVGSRNHVLVALSVAAALVSNLLEFPLLDRITGAAPSVCSRQARMPACVTRSTARSS